MRRVVVGLVAGLGFTVGCAHSPPVAPVRQTHIQMDPMVFQAKSGTPSDPAPTVELVDAAQYFERAGAAYGEKQWVDAVRLYDEGLARFPGSRYLVPSLYNSGLALEATGDLAGAVGRYRRLLGETSASTSDLLDAQFRLAGTLGKLKNWPGAVAEYAAILKRTGPCPSSETCELTVSDRVQALAQKGVAQFEMKDLPASERTLREVQVLYLKYAAEERLDTDFYLAMGAYYLGEIAHSQYRSLPVREKQLVEDLEQKGRQLLVAQRRYLDAMRVNNSEWATAAGYQIARLYHELYDDLVGAPIPSQLPPEAKEIYREEVKVRVKTLLQKAASIHERNVVMGERVGAKNEWVAKSNQEMAQLRQFLAGPTPLPQPSAAPAETGPDPPINPTSNPTTNPTTNPTINLPVAPDKRQLRPNDLVRSPVL